MLLLQLIGLALVIGAVAFVVLRIVRPAWRDFEYCRKPHLPPEHPFPRDDDLDQRLDKHRRL